MIRVLRALFPGVLWEVPTSERLVALTFDDGPHPATTPQLLDLLARHGARATFFAIGRQVEGNEGILERVVAEGHELGNHTMTSARSVTLGNAAFVRDLAAAGDLLARFGPVRWFRPASGWFRPPMLRTAARAGYRCALGSVSTTDIDSRRPARTAVRMSRRIRPGAVVVLHEGSSARTGIVSVTRALLDDLVERGYVMVTLSELSRREHPRVARPRESR